MRIIFSVILSLFFFSVPWRSILPHAAAGAKQQSEALINEKEMQEEKEGVFGSQPHICVQWAGVQLSERLVSLGIMGGPNA